jgi:hypothetical protein
MNAGMKLIAVVVVLGLASTACKGKQQESGAAGGAGVGSSGSAPAKPTEAKAPEATAPPAEATPANAKAPVVVITEADWVEKDLGTVSPTVRVTLRVPKHA